VHVDPLKPVVTAPGTILLKLRYDVPPSIFAFNFNLHRYIMDVDGGAADEAPTMAYRGFIGPAAAAAELELDPALNFAERAKYIPLRLDMEERKMLRLLEVGPDRCSSPS